MHINRSGRKQVGEGESGRGRKREREKEGEGESGRGRRREKEIREIVRSIGSSVLLYELESCIHVCIAIKHK